MNLRQPSVTDRVDGTAAGAADSAGERFARALADKDGVALRALLADPIDFQALTPRRHWQAASPDEVVDQIILGKWFDAGADIQRLESVSTGRLPGREHVSYLLRVRCPDGDYLVEQQAYYNAAGTRIAWMRVLCSGYQKLSQDGTG
jgi:hypothetical protein